MSRLVTAENDGRTQILEPQVLAPGEVAELFKVDPKTVTRWANSGKIASFRTLGGHRRFHRAVIEAALNGGGEA